MQQEEEEKEKEATLQELKAKLLRRAERLEQELQEIEREQRIVNQKAYARLIDKLCRVAYSIISLEKEERSSSQSGKEAEQGEKESDDLSLLLKRIQETRKQGDKKQLLKLIKKVFRQQDLRFSDDTATGTRRISNGAKKRLWIKQK